MIETKARRLMSFLHGDSLMLTWPTPEASLEKGVYLRFKVRPRWLMLFIAVDVMLEELEIRR